MTNNKLVIESEVDEIKTEDGGHAKIATICGPGSEEEGGIFIRFHSWVEELTRTSEDHKLFNSIMKEGRKIRLTLEVLEPKKRDKK